MKSDRLRLREGKRAITGGKAAEAGRDKDGTDKEEALILTLNFNSNGT